jgi:glutaredoxin-related protein
VSNLYLQTDWGVVDILSSVTGLGDFEAVRANSETFEISGKKFRLISLPDLVRAKESLGREKDILAAKELRAIAAMREKSKSGPELEPD